MKTILNFQKSLLLIISMAACFVSNAQFDPNFTQYMFNEAIINPGYAGSRECLSGTMLYRQQWVGLDGAPTTLTGSIHSPIMNGKLGAGINFVNEKIGVSQRTAVSANGAYRLGLKNVRSQNGIPASPCGRIPSYRSDPTELLDEPRPSRLRQVLRGCPFPESSCESYAYPEPGPARSHTASAIELT